VRVELGENKLANKWTNCTHWGRKSQADRELWSFLLRWRSSHQSTLCCQRDKTRISQVSS